MVTMTPKVTLLYVKSETLVTLSAYRYEQNLSIDKVFTQVHDEDKTTHHKNTKGIIISKLYFDRQTS